MLCVSSSLLLVLVLLVTGLTATTPMSLAGSSTPTPLDQGARSTPIMVNDATLTVTQAPPLSPRDATLIQVLQVFPNGHNQVAVAQAISTWSTMFHIDVLPISDFNNCFSDACVVNVRDPLTNLTASHPISFYDVLYFGVADQYGGYDLSVNGVSTVRSFAQRGKGLVFTHDTISTWEPAGAPVHHPNFCSISDVTGLTCVAPNQGVFQGMFASVRRTTTNVADPILNAPFVIPETFSTMQTHYYGQIIAQGTRLYDGYGSSFQGLYWHAYHNPTYGSNSSFYSYGHTENAPLEWEAKAMINAMYYSYHGRGYTLSGVMSAVNGDSIAGATVSAGSGLETMTDESGRYAFANLAGGDYTVTPAKSGYVFSPAVRPVSLQADAGGVNFSGWTTVTSFAVSGTIQTADGTRLAGGTVADGAGHSAVTDANGDYILDGLPAGSVTLTPTKTGYLFSPASVTLQVPRDSRRDFVARPDSCAGVSLTRNPVLLIPGWGGSAPSVDDDDNLSLVADYLEDRGYQIGCNLFYVEATSPYFDLRGNAEIIRNDLCRYSLEISRHYPAWNGHFDIIGHSYGGLRARAFIENSDFYDNTCSSLPSNSYKRVRVDHLITVGSPHGGEWGDLPMSYLIGLVGVGSFQLPAVAEIMPPVRAVQNRLHSQPIGVTYDLISGDYRSQDINMWLWPFPTVRLDANDLAVHRSSAHVLVELPDLYKRVNLQSTADIHGVSKAFSSLYNVNSYFNQSTTLDDCIWPILDRQSSGCRTAPSASAAGSSREPLAMLDEPQSIKGGTIMNIQAGMIGNGAASGTFEISDSGETQIVLAWTAGDVQLTLSDPTGHAVAPGDAGLTVETDQSDFGWRKIYHFAPIQTGVWSFSVVGTGLDNAVGYDVYAILTRPLTADVTLPATVAWGSPADLTATVLYDGASPVGGGSVTTRVLRPDGLAETITLHDDGLHNDGPANNGVFGGTYANTAAAGTYGIEVSAVGSYAGQTYKRTVHAAFTVAPNSADLGAAFSDRGIKEPGGLVYDWLEVSVPISVSQAGTFAVSADLYAEDVYLGHALSRQALEPGERQLELWFAGEAIYNSGRSGPYAVRNLLLVEEVQVDLPILSVTNAYTTGAYSYTEFGSHHLHLPLVQSHGE